MTLIAGLSFENVPMLLGDLLVHSHHDSERHVELPSVGDSRDIIEPGWGLSLSLCQKLFLINRFTAVAWSGRYIAAKGLISEFQSLVGDQKLSPARREDFFSALRSDSEYADVALIGITAISGREFDFFGYNVHSRPNPRFHPCIYAGSGSIDFPSTADFGPPLLLEGPPAERAISSAYALIGAFLTREINARSLATDTTPNPLLDLYGGGWELASVGDGTVYKLGDTASFFWDLHFRDDQTFQLRAPSLILKTDYVGTLLVRRWIRGDGRLVWSAPWSEQRCTFTRPIVGEHPPMDLSNPASWPPMPARFEVHVVLFTHDSGARYILTWTHWRNSMAPSANVRFLERRAKRCTAVHVQPQAVRMICSAIPSVVAHMKDSVNRR